MKDLSSYLTISEVSNKLCIPSHVLRFWEKKFKIINPKKSLGGRRYYSQYDVEGLEKIKTLLYSSGYTIKGAIKLMETKKIKFSNTDNLKTLENINLALEAIKKGKFLIDNNLN